MPTYFKIIDDTLGSISILDMNNSLEISIKHMSSFSFLFFWYVHFSKPHKKHIKREIYSLKFKVTPTKGLIRETNFLRLLIMGMTHIMCP